METWRDWLGGQLKGGRANRKKERSAFGETATNVGKLRLKAEHLKKNSGAGEGDASRQLELKEFACQLCIVWHWGSFRSLKTEQNSSTRLEEGWISYKKEGRSFSAGLARGLTALMWRRAVPE